MDKFYVWTIDKNRNISKVYANTAQVRFYLLHKDFTILRSATNQRASLTDSGIVVWTDIEEET